MQVGIRYSTTTAARSDIVVEIGAGIGELIAEVQVDVNGALECSQNVNPPADQWRKSVSGQKAGPGDNQVVVAVRNDHGKETRSIHEWRVPVEPSTKLATREKELLESFDAFLHEAFDGMKAGQGPQGLESPGKLQVFFLCVLAFDITLLYLAVVSVIPRGAENPVLVFLNKLLPVLGGALAVSFFDRLRGWLFKHSNNLKLGGALVLLLLVLLASQALVYSVFVQIEPSNSSVELDGKPASFDNPQTHRFLLVPKLRSYNIGVQDGANPKFEYEVHWLDVVKGTLARLPLLPRVLSPLKLAAAYPVAITFADERGRLYVSSPAGLPLEKSGLERISATSDLYKTCPSTNDCWTKTISTSGDVINLPKASYLFTEISDNKRCWREPLATEEKLTEVKLMKECK